jgi:hypothetical protein
MSESTTFSTQVADAVFQATCERLDLDTSASQMLRLGENAIYSLERYELVIRIARSPQRLERVKRELCMARWLHDVGIPGVEVDEDFEQPIIVDGFPVTFWKLIHAIGPKPRHPDLAALLARLHSFTDSPCKFPSFDPLGLVRTRIASAHGLSEDDRNFLLGHHHELAERYKQLQFALPVGPIHGDAWPGNLLRDENGVRLLDFEMTGYGPREWDLMPTVIAMSRYGLPKADYEAFSQTYGFDVTQWSGYTTLRDIREMTMTTWLMQNVLESPEIQEEFQVRLDSIRRRDYDRAWRIF